MLMLINTHSFSSSTSGLPQWDPFPLVYPTSLWTHPKAESSLDIQAISSATSGVQDLYVLGDRTPTISKAI